MKEFVEKLFARLEELKSSVMLNNKCCKHIIDKIITIINQLAEEHENDFCEWVEHEPYKVFPYKTSCYGVSVLYDGTFEFCPYCGKKIKVVE